MTFKEFVSWCNDRAADGCWGPMEAMICIQIMEDVKCAPFWVRRRYWKQEYAERVENEIVIPTNKKIEEVYGKKDDAK